MNTKIEKDKKEKDKEMKKIEEDKKKKDEEENMKIEEDKKKIEEDKKMKDKEENGKIDKNNNKIIQEDIMVVHMEINHIQDQIMDMEVNLDITKGQAHMEAHMDIMALME